MKREIKIEIEATDLYCFKCKYQIYERKAKVKCSLFKIDLLTNETGKTIRDTKCLLSELLREKK